MALIPRMFQVKKYHSHACLMAKAGVFMEMIAVQHWSLLIMSQVSWVVLEEEIIDKSLLEDDAI